MYEYSINYVNDIGERHQLIICAYNREDAVLKARHSVWDIDEIIEVKRR